MVHCWMMLRAVFLLSLCGWLSIRGLPLEGTGSVQLGNATNLGRDPRRGFSCDTNDWDREQWCLCRPGEKVSEISSFHDNGKEDRKWTLACSKIKPEFHVPNVNAWYGITTESKYDKPITWNGEPQNTFLVGMTSVHSNSKEDRQFKFFTVRNNNWYLTDCITHKNINNWDGKLKYTVGDDEVIAGLYSVHDNRKEDRRWNIKVCKLRKKCAEIIDIKYDFNHQDVAFGSVSVGRQVFNNIGGQSDNSYTAVISKSESESMSESFEFSQTSGTSSEVSMSISAGAKIGVPGISEYSLEMTLGGSHSWNFEKTWSRSSSREYSKSTGRQLSFTANCKKGCKCTLDISVKYGKGKVPYTMRSQSVDKKHQCVDKGVLKVASYFNGEAKANDVC